MFSPQLPVPADLGLSAVVVIPGHRPDWVHRRQTPPMTLSIAIQSW